jgi:chromosomal replication initiator protein
LRGVFDQALSVLRQRVSSESFGTYFVGLRYLDQDADAVVIGATGEFFASWVREHYLHILEEVFSEVAGHPLTVRIEVAPTGADVEPSAPPAPRAITATPMDEPHPFPLNPHNTFSRFVVGPNNEMAHAASLAVARDPARGFNPLFIYGGTGLGKTHLLHAVAHQIRANRPDARIAYVSAEEFTNQVIKSIARQEMDRLRTRFRASCDVLLMDDVHVLSGKERTQEEFFHTFNALHQAQKQIILTSDRTPQEIQHLEDRLRSRFQWGLITDVKPPQFETRVAILQGKAEQDRLELPDDVAFYLARLIASNVRELEGALTRLVAYASLRHEPLTVAFAQRALKDLLDNRARNVTIESIQRMVAEHYDVKVADLRGDRRLRTITHPRSVAMFLCRKHTQASFPSIGKGFGGKDHSTVLAACRRVEERMDDDSSLRSEIEAIERRLPA